MKMWTKKKMVISVHVKKIIVENTERKERNYKPYAELSAKRKSHRVREVKKLIMNIDNPTSNDDE